MNLPLIPFVGKTDSSPSKAFNNELFPAKRNN